MLDPLVGDRRAPVEYAVKQLAVMESTVKLHRLWVTRFSIDRVLPEFMQQWKLLQAFAESHPTIKLECGFLHDLVMQVQTCQVMHADVDLAAVMTLPLVHSMFPALDDNGVQSFGTANTPSCSERACAWIDALLFGNLWNHFVGVVLFCNLVCTVVSSLC